MRGEVWQLEGRHGDAEVQSLGGMLGPATFRVIGREIAPFVVAPWDDDDLPYQPSVLRHLRGEWPCVPFGMDGVRPTLAAEWRSKLVSADTVRDKDPHGYASNHDWHLVAHDGNSVRVAIDYPPDHAIARLERTVSLCEDAPAIALSLTIKARSTCRTSCGLHPVYRLSSNPGTIRLDLAPDARAWTFPIDVEPGRSVLQPDQRNVDPHNLASCDGKFRDLAALPFDAAGEDLALLTGLGGRLRLIYPADGYAVTQTWNAHHFPACVLWISGQGRLFAPWNGRFRGLGVEPVAAAFDLGPATSAAPNPLSAAGTPTSVALEPDRPLLTRYRIACEWLI